jgi:hypothetical protein
MTTTSPALQSKKPKTEHDGFETVKRYLLNCPHVPNDHPAVRAAVEGLEKEQKRRDRDLKLQAKFTNRTSTTTTTSITQAQAEADSDNNEETTRTNTNPYPQRQSSTSSTNSTEDSEMMEWQDVERKKEQQQEDPSSFLGKQLSQLAIQDMAQQDAKVSSPLAAIAVVLHACLRSELLGFLCTGIPETTTGQPSNNGFGFAPSIRELPKTTFLPLKWEDNATHISLRYRKPTIGALVLSVSLDDDRNVSIQMIRNQEPHGEPLEFPLADHINLDSWNAAQKTSGYSSGGRMAKIAPALHYKALHQLVTNVLRTFDLGVIDSEQAQDIESSAPYVDTTVVYSKTTNPIKKKLPALVLLPTVVSEPQPWQPREGHTQVPATIHQAFGREFPNAPGDFADDLTPGGLGDPLRHYGPGPGRMGGNMMGPNHPMFTGGPHMGGAPHMGGPGSMQPRFDPFLPPGVDPDGFDPDPRTQPPQQQQRRRRHPGEPNPDHLQPPNAFGGGDMFS